MTLPSARLAHRPGRRASTPARAVGAAAVAAAALAALVAAPASAAGPESGGGAQPPGKPLTVMTRNIYLGGDIMRPIHATAGKTGAAALVAFGNANDALRDVVDKTDFPTRSKLLAEEIATERPDVVGLQEVALWRSGPLELGAVGKANAGHVDYDFLAILTADLAATGADYRVVNVQEESDVEGPSFEGKPLRRHHHGRPRRPAHHARRDARARRPRPEGAGQRGRAVRHAPHGQDRRHAVHLHPRLQLGRRAGGVDDRARRQHPPGVGELRHRPGPGPRAAGRAREERELRRSSCATATPTRSTTP